MLLVIEELGRQGCFQFFLVLARSKLRTVGTSIEISTLTVACKVGLSWGRMDVSCLDHHFGSVDAGECLVLRGLSVRDIGYGLRGTLGSRSYFESDDPCNLAQSWEALDGTADDLPKVLLSGIQAIPLSLLALVLLYDFWGFLPNYFCYSLPTYTVGAIPEGT